MCVLINYYITDSQIRLKDIWNVWLLAVVYVCINYYFTEKLPEPVYPFLLWVHPWKDIFNCILCVLFGNLGMILSSWI